MMLKRTMLSIALVAASGVAVAQTTPNANQPSGGTAPPLATEGLAKSKIEASGYTGVKDLVKNADGTWSAKAMKDNQEIAVSVDAEGKVTSK